MLIIAVILMDLLAGMEFDLFVPSFPQLQAQFHLSSFWVEALLSVNFIGYCLGLFFVGSLADRYGRKPMILYGLGTFILGSVLCLASNTYLTLLIGRFLQGIGVSAPAIISFLLIADNYPLKRQQFLFALLNGVSNISVGLAPVIGSYVTLYFHWQGNFSALLFLGLLVLIMTGVCVPTVAPPEKQTTLSLRGYLPLFQSKPLMLLLAHIVAMIIPYWIFVGMSPLLYMKDFGVTLSHFGYYQGIFAILFAFGSILSGFVIHRFTHNKLLHFSNGLFIVSFLCMLGVTVTNSHEPLWITFAFIPFVIGQILPSNLLYPLCVNFIPEAKGKIAALISGGRLIFSALSLQMAGYFYQGNFQSTGILIMGFILMAILILFIILKQPYLIK